MTSEYIKTIQDEILTLLSDKPMTIAYMANRLKKPYPTVQTAHKELVDAGKVVKFDNRMRGARYTLGPNNGPKSIIPHVRINGVNHKMTAFQGTQNFPNSLLKYGHTFIKAWTTIAMTAERLHKGIPNDILVKRLQRQKAELLTIRSSFEEMVFLINQILDNPKFWDIESLSQFPDDADWSDFAPKLEQMYNYYYEQDSNDGTDS